MYIYIYTRIFGPREARFYLGSESVPFIKCLACLPNAHLLAFQGKQKCGTSHCLQSTRSSTCTKNFRTHNKTIQNRSKNGAWSTLGWHSEAQELHLQLPGSIMRDYGCQTGSHGCPERLPRRAKIITNEMKSRRQKGSERGGGKRPPKSLSKTPF